MRLNRGGDRAPLFCAPTFGGGVSAYLDLAQAVAPERSVWGIKAAGLRGEELPSPDVPVMAAAYVREMREVASGGPYLVAGWSFGAFVAYEVAQQLLALGEEVERLLLLAPPPQMPLPPPYAGIDDARRAHDEAIELVRMILAETDGGRDAFLLEARLADVLESSRMGVLLDLAPDRRELLHQLRVRSVHMNAGERYRLRPYPGRITVVEGQQDGLAPDAVAGRWAPWARGGLDVVLVPGEHETVLQPPGAAEIARHLRPA